jgi:calcineurin-like phosphoesterase
MTGPYDGVLGRKTDRVLSFNLTFVPTPFEVATGDVRLGGAIVDVDGATGRATAIRRIMVTEAEVAAWEAAARTSPS